MLRIQEALDLGKITKKELAEKLWLKGKENPRYQNIRLLISGKTKTHTPDQIIIICNETGVDPNTLYDWDKKKKKKNYK